MCKACFLRVPHCPVHMIITADHHNRFICLKHSGNILKVFFRGFRLVFKNQAAFRYAFPCQDIAHDSRFCKACIIRIAAGQNQLCLRVFLQVCPGCVQPCRQVRHRFSVFQRQPEHDGILCLTCCIDEAADDDFSAEEKDRCT